jgi:hypothetical protein
MGNTGKGLQPLSTEVRIKMGSSAGVCVAVLPSPRTVGSLLTIAFPLQKKPKMLPVSLFWRCTTVERTTDRRERNSDEFCHR